MAEPQNFMRVPDPSPKRTLYTDAMEIFHRAADTIGLAPRVRLELEEPDYEHIFYVTAKLKDRLRPLSPEAARIFAAAKDEIDQEIVRAKEALRDQVADLAVAGASKILKREVDAKAHADLLASIRQQL